MVTKINDYKFNLYCKNFYGLNDFINIIIKIYGYFLAKYEITLNTGIKKDFIWNRQRFNEFLDKNRENVKSLLIEFECVFPDFNKNLSILYFYFWIVKVLAPLPIGFAIFMVHLATIPVTIANNLCFYIK